MISEQPLTFSADQIADLRCLIAAVQKVNIWLDSDELRTIAETTDEIAKALEEQNIA